MKSFSQELFGIEKPNQSQCQKLIASKKTRSEFLSGPRFSFLEILSLFSFFSQSDIALINILCEVASHLEIIDLCF